MIHFWLLYNLPFSYMYVVNEFEWFRHLAFRRNMRERKIAESIWKIDPEDVKLKQSKISPMGSTKTVVSIEFCFFLYTFRIDPKNFEIPKFSIITRIFHKPGSSMSTTGSGTQVTGSDLSTSRILGLIEGKVELATFRNEQVVVKRIKALVSNLDSKALLNLRAVCSAITWK